MSIDIKDLLNNIWRIRNLILYSGEADAPTMYDTRNGFITGPSGSRKLYPGEQQLIDEYNDIFGQARENERLALEKFLKEILPLSWPPEEVPISIKRDTGKEGTKGTEVPRRDPLCWTWTATA